MSHSFDELVASMQELADGHFDDSSDILHIIKGILSVSDHSEAEKHQLCLNVLLQAEHSRLLGRQAQKNGVHEDACPIQGATLQDMLNQYQWSKGWDEQAYFETANIGPVVVRMPREQRRKADRILSEYISSPEKLKELFMAIRGPYEEQDYLHSIDMDENHSLVAETQKHIVVKDVRVEAKNRAN